MFRRLGRLGLENYFKVHNFGLRNLSLSKSRNMEELQTNPYYAKYAKKLQSVKESNPEEFQQKLDELEKKKIHDKLPLEMPSDGEQAQKDGLSAIMKVELLEQKTPEEITEIWKDYHTEKDCIFAVIKADEYRDIKEKASKFPNFLYPLPRDGGYEFFVQRWTDDTCHFAPLATIQKLKDNTPMCLSIQHYTELMDSKDIVLMRGYPDPKAMSVYEAQLLALQLKMYYGLHSGLKFNFVRIFNNNPESFRHLDLVVEFENYKKDSLMKKEFVFEGTPV